MIKQRDEAEISHLEALADLEIKHQRELADIEAQKFGELMEAIGQETVVEMARAGPELQSQLLKGLGLKGFVVMDGKNPVNLFNTANGLLGGAQQALPETK